MKFSIGCLLAFSLFLTLVPGCGESKPTSVTDSASDADVQAYKDRQAAREGKNDDNED